jgi:hypothetical protein
VVQHICESRLEARTTSSYFNINAFAPTPTGAGRIGNAGVGILEAPGTVAVSAGDGHPLIGPNTRLIGLFQV